MKFYKRDPDRALAGMNELSMKQRGAYNSLIDLLYSRDGDVPDDDLRVSKMVACHWREWKALKEELIALGKVWVEGGRLHAKRVQETIKDASAFAQSHRKTPSEEAQRPIKEPSEEPQTAVKQTSETGVKSKNPNENNEKILLPIDTATATPRFKEEKSTTIVVPKERRGTRVPDDFVPNTACSQKAEKLGMTEPEFQGAFENFMDYWRGVPGAKGLKLDWQATFRNSLEMYFTRTVTPKRRTTNGNGKPTPNLAASAIGARKILEKRYGLYRQDAAPADAGGGEVGVDVSE